VARAQQRLARRGARGTAHCVLAAALLFACSNAEAPRARGLDVPPNALVYGRGPDDARDLYIVPVEGGLPIRLTSHPAGDGLPRWTRDGRGVLFASNRTGDWQIWRVPIDGGEPERVLANEYREWQVDESPDGRFLAFLSNRAGPEFLWILDKETGDLRPLVEHGKRTIMGNPHWSSDGTRIVFSSNWKQGHQIYVVEVASGEARRISPVGGCEPRFSPDGTKVAYVHRRPREDKSVSAIVEHDLAKDEERVLVDWPALNYDPVYSPDGSEIAFASTVSGTWEIYRQRLAGGEARQVTFGEADARYPDYRPAAARP
jgi:Tol biopolymer transport system component